MKSLRISPEYKCSPLWVMEDEGIYENLGVENSIFESNLKTRIIGWANRFEKTLNQDYPPDSKFESSQEELQFEKDGCEIWSDVLNQGVRVFDQVIYHSILYQRDFKQINDYLSFSSAQSTSNNCEKR